MKIKGFRASHKNRWLLLSNKILTLQEFLLYEFDLDNININPESINYGTFEFFPEELAPIFNRGIDTIDDWHKGLLTKQFIQTHDPKRKLYLIKNPSRYEVGRRLQGEAAHYAKEEDDITIEKLLQTLTFSDTFSEKIPLEKEKILETTLDLDSDTSITYERSFKMNERSFPKYITIKGYPKTDEEYMNIWKNDFGSDSNFTPDFMKYIDQIPFKQRVDNVNQEKEIVRTIFEGNQEKYKNSLINF